MNKTDGFILLMMKYFIKKQKKKRNTTLLCTFLLLEKGASLTFRNKDFYQRIFVN